MPDPFPLSSFVRSARLVDLDSIEIWLQAIPGQSWHRSDLLQSLQDEDRMLLVFADTAVQAGCDTIRGFVMLQRVLDEATLMYLAVDPGCRRRGIAKALLQKLQTDCSALGCARIVLEVRESNSAARALYQDCGFQPVGMRRNYYPALEHHASRENAMVLAWLCSV